MNVEELKKFTNGKTKISYPGDNTLVFKLEIAFDIIVLHEERHYYQAKEVLEQMLVSNSR